MLCFASSRLRAARCLAVIIPIWILRPRTFGMDVISYGKHLIHQLLPKVLFWMIHRWVWLLDDRDGICRILRQAIPKVYAGQSKGRSVCRRVLQLFFFPVLPPQCGRGGAALLTAHARMLSAPHSSLLPEVLFLMIHSWVWLPDDRDDPELAAYFKPNLNLSYSNFSTGSTNPRPQTFG